MSVSDRKAMNQRVATLYGPASGSSIPLARQPWHGERAFVVFSIPIPFIRPTTDRSGLEPWGMSFRIKLCWKFAIVIAMLEVT